MKEGETRFYQRNLDRVYGDYSQLAGEIGRRFRVFRQLNGKTREEFSKGSKFPVNYFALLEKGEFIPSLLFIEYFSKKYGLSLTWLVRGEGDIFAKKGKNIKWNMKFGFE
jgi:transcriptional regulator with XRE-family HTH domain